MALTQISTAGVKDDAVTAGKIPANAVGSSELADNAVDTAAIAADAVTGAKISDDAVGAEHIEQLDADLQFIDGEGLLLGTGNDAALKFNGTDTLLTTAGKIKLYPDGDLEILDNSSGEYRAKFIDNGAVELYYDNSKKLETTSAGAAIIGSFYLKDASANTEIYYDSTSDSLNFKDSKYAYFGDDADLQIYHNGADSYIKNSTGNLYIRDTNGNIFIQPKTDENAIKCFADGKVELYYDNGVRAETMADGFKVSYSDDSGATTLKLENNSTHNSQNPKVKIAVDLANNKDGGSIEFIRGNNYQSSAAADSEIVISPTKNDTNTEIVRITQDWFRLHSNCSGIQFNSDTASANALNDYEEGSFDALLCGSSNPNTYYESGTGKYTKIGNKVDVHMTWDNINMNNSASGNIMIRNLPFTSSSHQYTTTTDHYMYNVGFNTGRIQSWYLDSSASTMQGIESKPDLDWDGWGVGNFVASGTYLRVHLTYLTA